MICARLAKDGYTKEQILEMDPDWVNYILFWPEEEGELKRSPSRLTSAPLSRATLLGLHYHNLGWRPDMIERQVQAILQSEKPPEKPPERKPAHGKRQPARSRPGTKRRSPGEDSPVG